jgi:hypothetical protein
MATSQAADVQHDPVSEAQFATRKTSPLAVPEPFHQRSALFWYALVMVFLFETVATRCRCLSGLTCTACSTRFAT